MSIIRCHKCERSVDTDFEETEIVEHKYGDVEICVRCAEEIWEWEEQQMEQAARAEYLYEKEHAK